MKFKASFLTMSALGLTLAGLTSTAFAATYQVQPNDTFWTIAQSQHVPLTTLESVNPTVNPMDLQMGQILQIPTTATKVNMSTTRSVTSPAKATSSANTYVVVGNDTFWSISRQLNIPLSALMAANAQINPLDLYPGLVLQLPTTTEQTVAASIAPTTEQTYTSSATPASVAQSTTASSPTVTTASGQTESYSKEISAVATAYTASAAENAWGAVDFLGNPLKLGTIAVDPSVIPLGSTVYVTGYSFTGLPMGGMICHATDEGSAIKGKRIDIFVPDSRSMADNFGFQNVKVYILK